MSTMRSMMAPSRQTAVFFDAMPGYADGIRVDTDGNVWCGFSGGEDEDGVAVFAPDGEADRPHPAARALRQRLFRRPEAKPPVHGGEPVGLFALCRGAGRSGG